MVEFFVLSEVKELEHLKRRWKMRCLAIIIGIVLILSVFGQVNEADARSRRFDVYRPDGGHWYVESFEDPTKRATIATSSDNVFIDMDVTFTGTTVEVRVVSIWDPVEGKFHSFFIAEQPDPITTPITKWGLSGGEVLGSLVANGYTTLIPGGTRISTGGWFSHSKVGSISQWDGSMFDMQVYDIGLSGFGLMAGFTAYDEPVPELPPGAMQMMLLMFGSALTWIKMHTK